MFFRRTYISKLAYLSLQIQTWHHFEPNLAGKIREKILEKLQMPFEVLFPKYFSGEIQNHLVLVTKWCHVTV